jgi:predicted dehydrogenase
VKYLFCLAERSASRRQAGGFNDLKIIEAHELLNRIAGKPSLTIDFDAGVAIVRTIHAIARSSREGRWVSLP